ncbi:hypothetical protein ACLMJK_007280 [Lecanora helva]
MASNHASLDAAATERKARLAKLKSLKRKQPPTDSEDTDAHPSEPAPSIPTEESSVALPQSTTQYLSGRNYDAETRGPKLGFEHAPDADAETLENRAAAIALEAKEKDSKESKEDKPVDLFQLQPKKPNWDLKRDVARKMEVLNARTENAIARLVRERIEGQKKKDREKVDSSDGGENLGMGGVELVEGMHVREREEEEDMRREREQDDDIS